MVEFANLLLVLAVTVAVACALCVLYATGLRLWAKSSGPLVPTELVRDGNATEVASDPRGSRADSSHTMARIGAVLCFGACVLIVIYALWLMIRCFISYLTAAKANATIDEGKCPHG